MAEGNPELRAKLQELDHELQEGDITAKGYEKRRTVLLSQYLGPEQAEQIRLRLHSASDDDLSPGTCDGSRAASFAALTGNLQEGRPITPTGRGYGNGSLGGFMQPPTQVGRFQERQLGVRNSSTNRQSSFGSRDSYLERPQTPNSYDHSNRGTMVSLDYRFNPSQQSMYEGETEGGYGSPGGHSRQSTMLDSAQGYFSDFAGQQSQEPPRDSYGGGPDKYYSTEGAFSPSANMPPPPAQDLPHAVIECMPPLEPREVPFDAFDPHNSNVPMTKFDNIGAVLQHRGKANGRTPAYWILDAKGKETASITFEKLHSRAEKVAQVIKDKSNLYRGDRVALVYRDSEIIDFAVSLLGCFLAGVVAVPMNNLEDYPKLSLLLTTTQAHLALTTDNNLKAFQRDISAQRLKWPTGVEWWKTNEFGSYHPKKSKDSATLPAPDLAYIEFSRAPTGDLRGVVLSHRTIMHQMACLQAIMSTVPTGTKRDTFNPSLRNSNGTFVAPVANTGGEVILSYLDPREGAGMILGVLLGVYGGHTTVWMESKTVETPGLYAHLISKYKTTVMVADYPGLKRAAYNYQQDPMATRNYKKGQEPNFATVKICLIETLTVDCEFHEILADRWLRPMRNPRAREIVAPMLCLPEHGGMIISARDWLGGEERMGCPLGAIEDHEEEEEPTKKESVDLGQSGGYTSLIGGGNVTKSNHKKSRTGLTEVLLDKEALKSNEVIVVATGDEVEKRANDPNVLRVGAFGYPIPDATLALVDPETSLLCPPYYVGELWVDSPSLSGGFWALPKHTETIFHARPYKFLEGSPTPVLVEPEFLRTGLLGCVIEGKIFVLGLYEDRIRQRVEWVDNGIPESEHRYFFVQHLVVSIMKNVLKIYDCSAFDSHVNGEYLPIVLIESQAASTAPTNPGGPPRQLDIPFLDSLAERVMDVLYHEHHLRVYCVMITLPNALPRVMKNGRREIGNMLCRKEFDNGSLACVHVKFGVESSVMNLPIGDDPSGGVWSPLASQARQHLLYDQDKQYSGVDYREVVMDEKTSTPLNQFSNIHDLMQWRVARQGEELAYCTIDGRGKEGKGVNWKKFDLKVAAVAQYLKNKVKVQPGDNLVLMYTHSEDFVYAIHACFCVGAVAIPMAPVDQNRLNEDAPALLHIVADFKVKAILVNNDVDTVLKQKVVSQHLKQSANILRVNVPNTYNTGKPPKQSHGCRDLGLTIRPQWIIKGHPVLVWVYWTPDQRRIAVQMSHATIMALCKVQKETCQMTSTSPVLGCVRSTMGLGFMHTCLMGIFLATPTYLVSPVDFAQNPNILFQTLSRYKIKNTYATSHMLDHAMAQAAGKSTGLHELKNLMITTESRPNAEVYSKVRLHFAQAGLDRTAINTIYSHVLNPMVASRSYMCIEPIELWLDTNYLRRGLIMPVHPETDPSALRVQDSGMVPVSTQINIVNPETNCLCQVGEYGEIWVQSEANVGGFYQSKDIFDKEKFNGRTVDGDPTVKYMRTGDLGFLHTVSRPIGPNGSPVEMQILFVLGSIGETFEVNGLIHFPMDIENIVERCHRNIVPGGCAVFQAGGLVVVLVEIFRKNFLASIVPVIVNAILNHHHLIVDIVAFVQKGDFPRSRLGEKQRGKILAGWVTRRIQTIAQFSIREPEDDNIGQIAEEAPSMKAGTMGSRNGTPTGLGLRRPESTGMSMTGAAMSTQPTTLSQAQAYQPEPRAQTYLPPGSGAGGIDYYQPQKPQQHDNAYELPAPLSIPELPSGSFLSEQDDDTPTELQHGQPQHNQLQLVTSRDSNPLHYSPIDPRNNPFASSPIDANTSSPSSFRAYDGVYEHSGVASSPHKPLHIANVPAYADKPYMHLPEVSNQYQHQHQQEENSYDRSADSSPPEGDRWTLPSQQRRMSGHRLNSQQTEYSDSPAPLRVANRDSNVEGKQKTTPPEEDEWSRDALGYLGYAGTGGVSGHYGK
ncbi:acetyl-CoA synthetase-like protein [Tothia fuscella]|uniref:Acetyl-CoA synthetase-like protein n=1 Tax=Tothia fuscella TaxID=1048955 RepID=A0A9P4NJM0_9PEZI|nr:acetyl-CoA synthetase-like protein [Tothia fuscella]